VAVSNHFEEYRAAGLSRTDATLQLFKAFCWAHLIPITFMALIITASVACGCVAVLIDLRIWTIKGGLQYEEAKRRIGRTEIKLGQEHQEKQERENC
jgi:hypothetical protein